MKVLIVSSTSFLKGCAICWSDSSSSFSLSPSLITSAGCSENSEIIYSTDNGRDCLVPSRTCTSRKVELNGNFFVRSIFVKVSVFHTLFLKSIRYAFFLRSFWTQCTSNFLSCINLQSNQFKKQRKDLTTFELENSNIISSGFRSPWHHPRPEGRMNFLNQNSNFMIKNRPGDQTISSI